jgi:hypothetical protein
VGINLELIYIDTGGYIEKGITFGGNWRGKPKINILLCGRTFIGYSYI